MDAQIDNNEFQPLDLQGDAVFGHINELMQNSKDKEAYSVVEKNYGSFSNRPEFLLLAAQVYKANENYNKECVALKKLVTFKNKPRYMTLLSEALANIEEFPAALNILHQIVDETDSKDPILFEVYKNMGNIYLKCGDIDAAEEKYNLANAINSNDESLIVNYGVLAIQKGEYDQAKSRFTQVIVMNNASDLAWVGLALVHRAFADHDLARACLLRGLDENPYNKLAISNFYQWCLQDGIDATDEIINAFVSKYPNDMEMEKLMKGLHQ